MREIEKIANEKFNGDIYKAIDFVYRNYASEENSLMDKIYSEFTQQELEMSAQVVRNLAIERSGKKKVKKIEKSIGIIKSLNLSDDEIIAAKENPYKKRMVISLISMFLVIVVPFLLYTFVNNSIQKWIESAQVILIGLLAVELADSIRKSYLFRKAKSILDSEE